MTSWLEAKCRASGMKMTGQRRLIVQVLSEAEDHPDIPELHRRVRERDERISLATEYRTARQLASARPRSVIPRFEIFPKPARRPEKFRQEFFACESSSPLCRWLVHYAVL